MTKREAAEAAATLRRLLDAVDRGELTAPGAMLARLDGAALALEAASRRS